jgi:hypothetical protein
MFVTAAAAGCGDKVTVNKAEKGGSGESCTRRDDCTPNLACIDNRCVSAAAAGGKDKTDGGMALETRGVAGESCTRRADCQSNLACVDQVCIPLTQLAAMPQGVRGDRGESCQARNDCAEGLACVSSQCVANEYNVAVQAKECFRVECSTTADCCDDFVASSSCPSWKAMCDAGDPSYCSYYEANCKCPYTCTDELCGVTTGCSVDADCGSSLLKCVSKKCVQCAVDADCTTFGTDYKCTKNVCKTGCKKNEECALFEACQNGACVDVGCTSDRECLFATHDPLSKCTDKKCVTPCTTDAECGGSFNVCEQGQCKFVGCETDEECRVLLGLENSIGHETAVCRDPEM